MEMLALTAEQEETLLQAFANVAVLIGAADGEMDEEEKTWSKKVAHIRTFSGHEQLFDFYKKLDTQIQDRVKTGLDRHADNPVLREEEIVDQLTEVNKVLGALDPQFGHYLYHDLKSYAKHIARASGGFLRFFSVNADESQWLDLPMIQEIVWEEEE